MANMLKPHDERLKEFLQEVRQELDYLTRSHEFSIRVLHGCVAAELELLIEDRFVGAVEARRFAYGALCQAKTQVEPETFYEALCAYDLGSFACDLWVHFSYFREEEKPIIYQVWHARKDFLPNLADIFYVVFDFVFRVRSGRALGLGFYYALKRPNDMYATFGQSCVYNDKPIGHVLDEGAMKRLKGLLRAYMQERNSSAGSKR